MHPKTVGTVSKAQTMRVLDISGAVFLLPSPLSIEHLASEETCLNFCSIISRREILTYINSSDLSP